MTCPQIFMALLFVFTGVYTAADKIRDRSISSGRATFLIMFVIGFMSLEAWVLHCGGFW